jgi:urease accessory protein
MSPTRTRERGATRVSVAAAADGGRVVVGLSASGSPERPGFRPILISSDRVGACVSLVPDGALLLAGDALWLDISVGPRVSLELVEPGGTVAYPMRGGHASWNVTISLAAGATLVWAGEPFVVAEGARVRRHTTIELGMGARLAMRETIVLGRHAEVGGQLDLTTTATGSDGLPILADGLSIGPESSSLLIGGARVIETVTVLGARIDSVAGTRLDLQAEGTLVRGLSSAVHTALPDSVWADAAQVARAI